MAYGGRRPTRAPLLTPQHRTQRLTWACVIANYTLTADKCCTHKADHRHAAYSEWEQRSLLDYYGHCSWEHVSKAYLLT
jgi:hypothetical protein